MGAPLPGLGANGELGAERRGVYIGFINQNTSLCLLLSINVASFPSSVSFSFICFSSAMLKPRGLLQGFELLDLRMTPQLLA